MARRLSLQLQFPRFERDGVTHRRDCECTRCDAGYRPSELERVQAAQRWEDQRARKAAETLLARQREKEEARAMRTAVALAEQERKTNEILREHAELLDRLKQDERLDALLAFRRQGMPVADAIAEVDRRFPPRPDERPQS